MNRRLKMQRESAAQRPHAGWCIAGAYLIELNPAVAVKEEIRIGSKH